MQAIIEKEIAIRQRHETIKRLITMELRTHQKSPNTVIQHPSVSDLRALKRFDASIYDREYQTKISLVKDYDRGFASPEELGFTVTPGPSLEIKILGTRVHSEISKPGFYALILPTNISEFGTLKSLPYLGTSKKLPVLQRGDVVFGEAGFQKGRSIVLIDHIDRCTTNAHGLYARRTDGDLDKSVFFRCIFDWYRSMRLIDLMAVGGSGGHFSPEYFNYLLVPNFPSAVQTEIVQCYHNSGGLTSDTVTLENFIHWHRRRNQTLGIWELDRDMKRLQRVLTEVQEQVINGDSVEVPHQ
jgi:type I restriction enzyme S subunit